ncbi:hypothetical protein [Mycobacterium sp. 1274756.6]|uniref:hypothetical protein n=1 Tax=Mycobacterium sp. 1274756.6 TaxID=1834076 RepID=UPI0007FBB661|nr:hypothetical protein [Mycobacterium sp. 1274756.6]OBJ72914.1 hypothetical protein A5643_05000 [Mycobacterium sp. 1274756.6]
MGVLLAVSATQSGQIQDRHNARLQRRLTKTTWMSGCRSWYLTADGYNAAMYSGFATQYLR